MVLKAAPLKLRNALLPLTDCYFLATSDPLHTKVVTTDSSLERVRPDTILLSDSECLDD